MEFASEVSTGGETGLSESEPKSNETASPTSADSPLCDRCRSLDLSSVIDRKLARQNLPDTLWDKSRPYTWKVDKRENIQADAPCRCHLCQILFQDSLGSGARIGAHSTQTLFKNDHVVDTTIFEIDAFSTTLLVPDPGHRQVGPESGDAPADNEGRPRIVGRTIDKRRVDISLVREWLHDCSQNHGPSCSGADSERPMAALNVIDCQTRKIVALPDDGTYAALSYLRGQNWKARNSAATQPRQLRDPLGSNLPRVVEDAMVVAKKIGISYLWVDRYCIDQADAAEKHRLIRHMDQIYNGAAITIIDASGHDAHSGLRGVSRDRQRQGSITIGGCRFLVFPDSTEEVRKSSWSTGAWTYQEGLLSRRRLVFTGSQVYFQCMKTYAWEGLSMPPDTTTQQISFYRVFPEDGIGRHAQDIVKRLNEYASRQLTFGSGSLNAILGIFRPFQDKQVYHLWGVPFFADSAPGNMERNFVMALSWNTRVPDQARCRSNFPTWSWVGWKRLDNLTVPWAPESKSPIEDTLPISVHVFQGPPASGVETSLPDYVSHIAKGVDHAEFSQLIRVTGPASQCRIHSPWRVDVDLPIELMGHGRTSIVRMMAAQDAEYPTLFPKPLDILYLGYHATSTVSFHFIILDKMPGTHQYTRAGTLSILVPRSLLDDFKFGNPMRDIRSWLPRAIESLRKKWQVESFILT